MKKITAFLLIIVLVFSYTPAYAKENIVEKIELPSYMAEVYKKPYDGGGNKENKLKSEDKVNLDDTLYFYLTKEEMNGIEENHSYIITLPECFASKATMDETPITVNDGERDITVGKYSIDENALNIIEIVFNIEDEESGISINDLHDFYLTFEIGFDRNMVEENVDKDTGKLSLDINKESVAIYIEEYIPPEPEAPQITKSNNGISQDGIITWKINYKPGNRTYEEVSPNQLRDVIPDGLIFDEESVKGIGSESVKIDESGDVIFTIDNAKEYEITYNTSLDEKQWIEIFKGNKNRRFENTVIAEVINESEEPVRWGEEIKSIAEGTVTSNLIGKTSTDIDYDSQSNKCQAEHRGKLYNRT